MSNVERARENYAMNFTRHFVTHLSALYGLEGDRNGIDNRVRLVSFKKKNHQRRQAHVIRNVIELHNLP